MNALKIAVIGMAVLVMSVGAAAAAPGNAPSGTPAGDDATNASEHSATNETANASAAEDHGAVVDERGPPTSLPSPVPDFVGNIHDAIRGFMQGAVDDLGTTISEIAGGDATENADTNSTSSA